MYQIDDDIIESISILAKLELSKAEKEQAKKDLKQMMKFMNQLDEIDTKQIHAENDDFSVYNVFREDEVENTDQSNDIMANAPKKNSNMFEVPNTVLQQS